MIQGIFTGFTVEHAYSLLPAVTGFFFSWLRATEALKQAAMMGVDSVGERQSLQPSGNGGAEPMLIHLEEDTVEDQGLGDECWIVKKRLIKGPLMF